MKIEDHLKHEKEVYLTESLEVHQEIDSLFKIFNSKHRKYRHHLDYILEKYKKGEWNVKQCRAAILHLMDDNDGKIMIEVEYMG